MDIKPEAEASWIEDEDIAHASYPLSAHPPHEIVLCEYRRAELADRLVWYVCTAAPLSRK